MNSISCLCNYVQTMAVPGCDPFGREWGLGGGGGVGVPEPCWLFNFRLNKKSLCTPPPLHLFTQPIWRGAGNEVLMDTWCNVKFSCCFTSKYKAIWKENLEDNHTSLRAFFHAPVHILHLVNKITHLQTKILNTEWWEQITQSTADTNNIIS